MFLAPHSAPASEHEEVSLQLWDVTVSGLCCGPEVAAWLGAFLGGGAEVRLLQHAQDGATRRRARGKYLATYPRTFPATCIPGFADVTPYMLTTQVTAIQYFSHKYKYFYFVFVQPSLEDLQARLPPHLASEVTQTTFRPNLVVAGAGLRAWQEDGWVGELRVGETTFVYNRDCTRCVATTVRSHTDLLPFCFSSFFKSSMLISL